MSEQARITDIQQTRAQKRTAALDEWENLDAKVRSLSSQRIAARNRVLALSRHDQRANASSGATYRMIDEVVQVKSHEAVAREIADRAGMSEAALAKLYEQTAGQRRVREIRAA